MWAIDIRTRQGWRTQLHTVKLAAEDAREQHVRQGKEVTAPYWIPETQVSCYADRLYR